MKKILKNLIMAVLLLCCAFFSKETQVKSYAERPTITGPTNIYVDYRYDYRDFVIKSSYGSFKLTTDVDWISFYQTSFTKTKGVVETTPVLYMPKRNSTNQSRKATVTVSFTESEFRNKSYSFTITQGAGAEKGPTIMVGSKTYNNPEMIDGVIKIDYNERSYIDSMQTIMICSPYAYTHTAEEVEQNNREKYIGYKTNNCHNDCQVYLRKNSWNEVCINPYRGTIFPESLPEDNSPKPKHIIQIYFSAYKITNSNKGSKWEIVPELKIEVTGDGGEFTNHKKITYLIRFTNIILTEGPTNLRPFSAEVYNPTGNSAGIHAPSSGPNPEEWVSCYYCGTLLRYGGMQSHYSNCRKYLECHNPWVYILPKFYEKAADPREWWKNPNVE